MKKKSIAIGWLMSTMLCVSCGEYELLEFQKECKRIADSTYKADIKILAAEADSLCTMNYDHYYKQAKDSLIPARIAELEKLFGR